MLALVAAGDLNEKPHGRQVVAVGGDAPGPRQLRQPRPFCRLLAAEVRLGRVDEAVAARVGSAQGLRKALREPAEVVAWQRRGVKDGRGPEWGGEGRREEKYWTRRPPLVKKMTDERLGSVPDTDFIIP